MNHITIVAGARPNFMKVAPILHEIKRRKAEGVDIEYSLVHTGQHYDKKMSGDFFEQLNIPEPDANLSAGGGTQAKQTGAIMIRFEEYLMKYPTDLVLVVGDVTSTMACAITAQKLHIKVAHVEAGIRSNDWSMPEEINRIIVDELSDYFFVTEQSGWDNLKEDGKDMNNVFFVGNTMIDSLKAFNKEIHSKKFSFIYDQSRPYLAMTLHRPSNVDNEKGLLKVLALLKHCSQHFQVIFPMHPRTKKNIDLFNLTKDFDDVKEVVYTEPLDYFTFQKLIACADGVITDSGGIQEETTFIGVPCVTLRENTERPITIDIGTNELMNFDPPGILKKLIELGYRKNQVPPLWDGNATQRIAEKLNEIYSA